MIQISYASMMILISAIWILTRAIFWIRDKRVNWKREVQLLLVYICIIVVVRFTFFPFSKVDGEVQPLIFETATAFSFRINFIPFVNLFDYSEMRDILINVIGNTSMFIPLGVVWPIVFKELDTHKKAILAGVGVSLCIEILQLPFYVRVSDIDDLILNSLGYLMGYGLYHLCKRIRKRRYKNEGL